MAWTINPEISWDNRIFVTVWVTNLPIRNQGDPFFFHLAPFILLFCNMTIQSSNMLISLYVLKKIPLQKIKFCGIVFQIHLIKQSNGLIKLKALQFHVASKTITSAHAKNFFWRIIDMPLWEQLFKILLHSVS